MNDEVHHCGATHCKIARHGLSDPSWRPALLHEAILPQNPSEALAVKAIDRLTLTATPQISPRIEAMSVAR